MKRLLLVVCLVLSACVPMSEFRVEETGAPSPVIAFCAAMASGDPAKVAELFDEKVSSAINASVAAGEPPPFASRPMAKNCRPGRAWYWGGSRMVYEVSYDGFADRLDMWRSSEPKFTELHYGDGGPTLKENIGLRSGVVRPF